MQGSQPMLFFCLFSTSYHFSRLKSIFEQMDPAVEIYHDEVQRVLIANILQFWMAARSTVSARSATAIVAEGFLQQKQSRHADPRPPLSPLRPEGDPGGCIACTRQAWCKRDQRIHSSVGAGSNPLVRESLRVLLQQSWSAQMIQGVQACNCWQGATLVTCNKTQRFTNTVLDAYPATKTQRFK